MRVKLRDVCSSIYDGDHNAPPKSEHGVPFITISNIDANDGAIDFSNTAFVSEEYYESLKVERRPKCNDVLYSVVGSFGIPSLVRNDSKFVFQRHIAILRPSKAIDPAYLYYVLKDPSFFHWADAVAIGAAQRTVTLGQLRAKEIELPDMETQRHVADVLSAYDELIENNRRQIKLLEEAAQRLYKKWFIDLKFPGHETTPVVDGLPEGWQKGHLLDCADFYRGKSYTSDNLDDSGNMRLANLNSIAPYGGWAFGAEKPYKGECKAEQLISSGDVIMAVTDMTKERRLVGHVARVPKQADGFLMSMDLIKLVPKSITENYLYAALRFSGVAEMIAMLANGTNVLHLKPGALSRVGFVSPDRETQERFSIVSESLFAMCEHLEQKVALAREARDRLLPKLMSGEIEV